MCSRRWATSARAGSSCAPRSRCRAGTPTTVRFHLGDERAGARGGGGGRLGQPRSGRGPRGDGAALHPARRARLPTASAASYRWSAARSRSAHRHHLGHPQQHRGALLDSQDARRRAHRPLGLPRRRGGLRRQPERVLRHREGPLRGDAARQPRRRRRRPDGLLVLLRGRAPRARLVGHAADPRQHGLAQGAALHLPDRRRGLLPRLARSTPRPTSTSSPSSRPRT